MDSNQARAVAGLLSHSLRRGHRHRGEVPSVRGRRISSSCVPGLLPTSYDKIYWSKRGVPKDYATACHFVFGFGVQASVQRKKVRIEYRGRSEERGPAKRGVRPADPSNIKGVTKATRAEPFRPLLREHSGKGTSQPCALHKTETAAVAVQPPGVTWRNYNPEEGERVVRTSVLARCDQHKLSQHLNAASQ